MKKTTIHIDPMNEEKALKEYLSRVREELGAERHKLSRLIKTFSMRYEKMPTNVFYRRCAYTHKTLYNVPKDFPSQLYLAKIPQLAIFYSNLGRVCLLIKENYDGELLHQANRPTTLFSIHPDIDHLTQLENKLEYYKYLNGILHNVRLTEIKRELKASPQDHRLDELEKRVNNLEREFRKIKKEGHYEDISGEKEST